MRLWHVDLFEYLPNRQFRGQLRELLVIMRNWRDKGRTNSLIINPVMSYDKAELYTYFIRYDNEYYKRYNKHIRDTYKQEFVDFCGGTLTTKTVFKDWHNNQYLKICVTNLYEKYRFGIGKSRITEEEWNTLLIGYRLLTGENFQI